MQGSPNQPAGGVTPQRSVQATPMDNAAQAPSSGAPSQQQPSASDHATNGQNAVQQAISFIEAVLSGDAATV